jgi:hypothetical protein
MLLRIPFLGERKAKHKLMEISRRDDDDDAAGLGMSRRLRRPHFPPPESQDLPAALPRICEGPLTGIAGPGLKCPGGLGQGLGGCEM